MSVARDDDCETWRPPSGRPIEVSSLHRIENSFRTMRMYPRPFRALRRAWCRYGVLDEEALFGLPSLAPLPADLLDRAAE